MSGQKLLFLATEDWFVRSHFEPLLSRALEEGFEVAVAARQSGALAHVRDVRLIDLPVARSSTFNLWREADAIRSLLQRERPALVHAVALRPIAALLLAPAAPSVFAVTGRGYLALQRTPWARTTLALVASGVRQRLQDGLGVLLVENRCDLEWVRGKSASLPSDRVMLMPGAGVDLARHPEAEEPPHPVVVGVAARLVRSKGVDVAVEAVGRLRERGVDVSLRIAGAPDPDNPESVSEGDLVRWRALPGVELVGRVADMHDFWAGVHIACLPSRGGEGLPRVLLEAAACARPIVTTNTSGCSEFVEHQGNGLVVPPNDAAALASAIASLAEDGARRRHFGLAAREKVRTGYTISHAAAVAANAWRVACQTGALA